MNRNNVAWCTQCGLEISIDLLRAELEARNWGGYFVQLRHREESADGCIVVRHRVESYVYRRRCGKGNKREAKHCRFYVGGGKLREWGLVA